MATQDPTVNYNWDLPNVSGDTGNWGALLNTILGDTVTGIDKRLFDATATADAALPKAGGVLTGDIEVFTSHAVGGTITSGSGVKVVNLATANFWKSVGSLSGAVTLNLTNPQSASGDFEAVILHLQNAGAASSISFQEDGGAVTIKWQDGAAPTWTASGDDVIVLYTPFGGGTWFGAVAIQDPS